MQVKTPGHISDYELCKQACWYENCALIDDKHYKNECALECSRDCGVKWACRQLARLVCRDEIMCLWGFSMECHEKIHILLDKLEDDRKKLLAAGPG